MKLFLSSQDLGDFAEDLRELVGENRKTLLIANARDYADSKTKAEVVARKLTMMKDAGFDAIELDLRQYFSKDPTELFQFVSDYNPGLICCTGGSVFLLGTAMAISGMDDIIRRLLEEDTVVYAGYSAGAMVASKDIENYERDDLRIETIQEYYGTPAITDGLGLIEEYIIPHADQKAYSKETQFYKDHLTQMGVETIVLNNQDAYIVNGNHKVIKRAS